MRYIRACASPPSVHPCGPSKTWIPLFPFETLLNDMISLLSRLNSRDTHPLVQFIKYSISGGVATAVFAGAYLLLAHWFPTAEGASTWVKFRDTLPPTGIAFFFANLAAYWLNTRWVFTPGRHSLVMEFLYFTLVNMPGAIGGTLVQGLLIAQYGWSKPAALAGFLLPNILINYVCRKFFIFKG